MCEPRLLRLSRGCHSERSEESLPPVVVLGRDASTPNELATRPRSALSMTEILAWLIRLPCCSRHKAAGSVRGRDDSLG